MMWHLHNGKGSDMKQRVNITIEDDLKKRIEELATAERRSFTAQVAVMLEEAIDKRKVAA